MCSNKAVLLACALFCTAAAAQAQPTIKLQTGGTLSAVCGSTNNGGDITMNLDNVATGDITVLFGGAGASAPAIGPITLGYSTLAIFPTNNPVWGVFFKVQGATPDASVQAEGGGQGSDGVAYCTYVLDGTTVHGDLIDNTSTTAEATRVADCDDAVLTITANALVVCHYAADNVDTAQGTVAGYTTFNNGVAGNDNDDIAIGGARAVIVSPTTADPPAWSAWASAVGSGFTVAWKAVAPAAPCGSRSLLGVGC